jgi:hypothetical protein
MIDAEVYLDQLLDLSMTATPFVEDLWVAPDIDVTIMQHFPALTWNIVGDGEPLNGPDAYGIILNASVFGEGMDAAKAVARYVDRTVMAWFEDPWPTAITVDGDRIVVSNGERLDLMTRLAAAEIEGRNVVQYSGSFRILLRA